MTTATTEAIVLRQHGDPSMLRLEPVPPAPVGTGELRIRHLAIGVNFHDIYVRSGLYHTLALPGIPGLEAVGYVEEVGAGVTHFSVGDRIAYVDAGYGAYAQERILRSNLAVQIPDGIDDRVAGSMFLKGLTAAVLLYKCHPIQHGQTVLVHAAAGGVGSLLAQWASHLGARVIGTVGSEEKIAIARSAGCETIINYREEDFADSVLDITSGMGVNIVYDAVGRDTFDGSVRSLGVLGHLLNYGQASGPVPPFDIMRLAQKGLTLSRPAYAHHVRTPETLRDIAELFFSALGEGVIAPEQGASFTLANAAAAHQALEGREKGPFVLLP